jgi:hypothetical protein
MDIRFEPVTFTSAETEAVTGISGEQQRNFRRADHLERQVGHNMIIPIQLAKLLIMRKLDLLHVPPSASSKIAGLTKASHSAAELILAFAQDFPDTVDDPQDRAEGEKPIKVSPGGIAARFLVVAGDRPRFVKDLSGIQGDENDSPAVIVIDLRAMAAELVKRANKPLWRVV